MLVPLKWLREYVDIDGIDVKTYSEEMIMSGSNIEEVESLGEEIEKVVVGRILEIKKHPDADKLVITQVDVGDEVIQIVTGAQNIKVDQYVPIVLAGGKLPGGIKIKKGKLRGEVSNGMMCSATELGMVDKVIPAYQKDGIYILDKPYPLGADIKEILGLHGHVVDFEITPNRPDCLSMMGMARETAATFGLNMEYPEINIQNEHGNISDYASVEVKNAKLCRRYVARVVTDIEIKESPEWLQRKLMESGIRPISNVVDITNFVMLELGQPLHAFDLSNLEEHKIIVKNAEEGQLFKTLDGIERKLDKDMLTICDGKKAVALAGVMGGENSEITDHTKTILIESANFLGDNVRATSKKLGFRTEASGRYEKGVDPNICLMAANRACQLIEELGIGKVVTGVIDAYEEKLDKKVIPLRPNRLNALLGTNIEDGEIIRILESLEMKIQQQENQLLVTVPTFRQDIVAEIDFVEEVARIYGFENLPTTIPKGNTQGGKTNGQIIEDFTKEILNSTGLNEIQTYSFVSPKSLDMIGVSEDSFMRRAVKLINPLGEENSMMRTTIMTNMLEVLARNYNRNVEEVKAFELGNIFIPHSIPVDRLPIEKRMVTLGMYGKELDFYSIKGVVEILFERLGITDIEYMPEKNHPTFHPGRCANVVYGDHILGVIGEVHPSISENYGIDARIYLGELDFNILMQIARLDRLYKPLPKYPAITRDMALVVKDDIYVKQIEDIVKENDQGILESVKLFDVYKGKQIQEGYKSVAYSLIYRAENKTLVDEEVTTVHNRIVALLNERLGAQLR